MQRAYILLEISTNSRQTSSFSLGCVSIKLVLFFLQDLQGTSWWSEFAFEKLLLGLAKEVTRFVQFYSFSFLVVPSMKCSTHWKVGLIEAVLQRGIHHS